MTSSLYWAPSPTKALGVAAVAAEVTGSFTLHWGDGTTVDGATAGTPLHHTYTGAGAYVAAAVQAGATVARVQVFVRPGLAPAITFAAAADNPNIIEATVGDEPAELVSRYRIAWGDGSAAQELVAEKGQVISHGFKAGTYTITVTDLRTRRVLREQQVVTDAEYDPDFTLAKGADANTARATLSRVLADPAKDVLLDWGDGEQTTLPAAKVGDHADHTYAAADTYLVQCVYTDGSTDGSAKTVTIPFATVATDAQKGGKTAGRQAR